MRRVWVVLLAVATLPYFVGLGDSSIWDANEAYYVETPREMLERGDYINPSFNYEPRFNKPVLSYWIVAGLYNVFGVSVAVERLAIALAGVLIIAAAFAMGRAVSPHPAAPWLAALGVAAGPRFFMFSRRILVDMAVTAFMTLTLLFFILAEQFPARRRLFLSLMYVCVGLGVLTKGPVAAVIPAIVFLAYLAVHRELGRIRDMMIPAGTGIALAIAAPWYVALYLQHGWTYITGFFIGENLGRFTETVGVQARGPLFYLPVMFTDALPWSLCLPAAVAAWVAERHRTGRHPVDRHAADRHPADRYQRMRTLLLLWVTVIVGLFSLSRTKQDLYIFPIVAAIAVLGGDWVARASDRGPAASSSSDTTWFTATLVSLALSLVGLGAFVLYVFGPSQTVYRIPGAATIGGLGVAGGLLTGALVSRGARQHAVAIVLAVFVAFNWVLVARALPGFEPYKPVVPLSHIIERRAGPGDVVAQFDVSLPSMVFYLRRHVDVLLDEAMLVEQLRSGRRVFAVLPEDRYLALQQESGLPTCVIARHPTSDIRLRSVLRMEPPPHVVLITNRCGEV